MQVERLFIDVVKVGGVPQIKVVDSQTCYRANFNLRLELLNTNIEDRSFYNYVYDAVRRNYDLLNERAGELK